MARIKPWGTRDILTTRIELLRIAADLHAEVKVDPNYLVQVAKLFEAYVMMGTGKPPTDEPPD